MLQDGPRAVPVSISQRIAAARSPPALVHACHGPARMAAVTSPPRRPAAWQGKDAVLTGAVLDCGLRVRAGAVFGQLKTVGKKGEGLRQATVETLEDKRCRRLAVNLCHLTRGTLVFKPSQLARHFAARPGARGAREAQGVPGMGSRASRGGRGWGAEGARGARESCTVMLAPSPSLARSLDRSVLLPGCARRSRGAR